jgi:hypothetical protein
MSMSLLQRVRELRAELAQHGIDPWRRIIERGVPADVTSISTVGLLDLIGVRATTGNARRLAKTMRSLGWVALKSRRLMPGGWRNTEGRGWARPLREPVRKVRRRKGGTYPLSAQS